ncbi:hypothetical protein NC652_006751 [Populus alba x Populus x berolinensis]|nr:hypothetical protein NC652_006751 [Populus alba x Populus x berolinensis]
MRKVSDVNLEEDEVLKRASFGNEANNKDTVDIIRKSVVILIISGLAQMIVLLPSSDKGRRIDMVIEVKDNETLRALKAPKKTKCKGIVTECIKDNFNALSTSVSSIAAHVILDSDSKHQTREAVNSTLAKSETVSYIHRTAINNDNCNTIDSATDDEVSSSLDDIREVWPILNIRKDSLSPAPLSRPAQAKQGISGHASYKCKCGDLIASGSDGRGGRVKVPRSMNLSSLDAKENSLSSKKCKYEAKTSNLQSQGSLQIEHFFGEPVSNQRKVVHKAIATHLDSVNGIMNLELGTVMNHFWYSEINISPLMVQKICTSFIVQTCPDQQSTRCDPFWCRKDYYTCRINLSNQGHIMITNTCMVLPLACRFPKLMVC